MGVHADGGLEIKISLILVLVQHRSPRHLLGWTIGIDKSNDRFRRVFIIALRFDGAGGVNIAFQ